MKNLESAAGRVLASVIGLFCVGIIFFWSGCSSCQDDAAKKQAPNQNAGTVGTTPAEVIQPQPEPVEPAPSKPAPTVVQTPQGDYTVQVSSWRYRANAEKDLRRFEVDGIDGYIQKADVPSKGGTWYRVRVGRGLSQDQAERLAADLAQLLESGFWIDRLRQDEIIQ